MRGLREEDGESQDLPQFVFILASREEGPMKGVRYRMSGQSVTAGAPEGEVVEKSADENEFAGLTEGKFIEKSVDKDKFMKELEEVPVQEDF